MKLALAYNGTVLLECIQTLKEFGFESEPTYGDRCMLALKEAVETYKERNFNDREELKHCRNSALIYRGLDMNLIQLI